MGASNKDGVGALDRCSGDGGGRRKNLLGGGEAVGEGVGGCEISL